MTTSSPFATTAAAQRLWTQVWCVLYELSRGRAIAGSQRHGCRRKCAPYQRVPAARAPSTSQPAHPHRNPPASEHGPTANAGSEQEREVARLRPIVHSAPAETGTYLCCRSPLHRDFFHDLCAGHPGLQETLIKRAWRGKSAVHRRHVSNTAIKSSSSTTIIRRLPAR